MRTVILQINSYDDTLHRNEIIRDIRFDADMDAVAKALEQGLYVAVAVSEESDLDLLYERTQNGVAHDSWSRAEDPAYTVLGGGTITGVDGTSLGYMSTSMGDVFVVDGVPNVVARFGFTALDVKPPAAEDIAVVNGGKLSEHMATLQASPGI